MKLYSRPLLAVALMLAVLAAACGSGDADSPSPTSTSSASSQATSTAASTPGAGESTPTGEFALWCPSGIASQTSVPGATGSSTIEGLVEFKGQTYCKAFSTTSTSGITVNYSYYYNQDSSDIWAVMDVNGRVTETHYVNGQVAGTEQGVGSETEWCVTGSTPQGAAAYYGTIEGEVEFKGGSYCKAVSDQTAGGYPVIYNYYFTRNMTDVWLVMNVNGQETETHVFGGN